MALTETPIIAPNIEPMDEVAEILARGMLRLLIAKQKKPYQVVNKLDLSQVVSNELDTQLTAIK